MTAQPYNRFVFVSWSWHLLCNVSVNSNWFFCSAVTHTLKKSEELPLACLHEVFTGLWLSTSTFCIKGYDYVKNFVRVLVLLVINTGCLEKFLKTGEHYIVDFQFNLC